MLCSGGKLSRIVDKLTLRWIVIKKTIALACSHDSSTQIHFLESLSPFRGARIMRKPSDIYLTSSANRTTIIAQSP